MSKLIGRMIEVNNKMYQILEDITHPKSDTIRYTARTFNMAIDEASHVIELKNGELKAIAL
jgi:hypothetical protein